MTNRKALPARRRADTFRFRFRDARGSFHVTLGYYDEGPVGEIFLNCPKVGTEMETIARACAVLASIALQHGATLSELAGALPKEEDNSQSTVIGAVLEEIIKKKLDVYSEEMPVREHSELVARARKLVTDELRANLAIEPST